MSKWQDGELLHTLHSERQFRLNGYEPIAVQATRADCVNVEAKLREKFPDTWALEHTQPQMLAMALGELELIEQLR